ncbi:carbohydrate porin [Telmatospirillum sp.]|uniref:carbohydrate porin n=1 Tax=Telmatospirillum sp. TaxID=2079197 RepID=UPI00284E9BCD|nr:carbohydrate porin [Telmatospirillum sp.]MDR3437395.1 carbohydrate porin [Telmatospirillum sp.]
MKYPGNAHKQKSAGTWRRQLATSMMGLSLLAAAPALAQEVDPTAPAEPLRGAHLFGDWGGMQPWLLNHGFQVSFQWTTESTANIAGGNHVGGGYADERLMYVHTDWDKLAGIPGFKTHMAFTNRAGNDATDKAVGDPLMKTMEVHGSAYDRGIRIPKFILEESLWDDMVSIAGGRGSTNELSLDPFQCNFMNQTVCGTVRTFGYVGAGGAWPMSTWYARIRVRPTPDTYVMGALGLAEPAPGGGRKGFDWFDLKSASSDPNCINGGSSRSASPGDTTSKTGCLTGRDHRLAFGWTPKFGQDQLPGEYRIGAGYDDKYRNDFYSNSLGQPYRRYSANTVAGKAALVNGASYAWFNARQMIMRNGPGPQDGVILDLYLPYVVTNNVVALKDFAFAGLSDRGFWKSRPEDQINFGVSYYAMDAAYTLAEQNFGINAIAGSSLSGKGVPSVPLYGVQKMGWVYELNYNLPIYRGVELQPGIQYWVHPGAQNVVPNATVLELRTRVVF